MGSEHFLQICVLFSKREYLRILFVSSTIVWILVESCTSPVSPVEPPARGCQEEDLCPAPIPHHSDWMTVISYTSTSISTSTS
ncbi:hypothetical protein BT96DRAFT_1010205 [Gymnopus androsaceus JB14]|uniref:Uncharacterized protein n=1 Tax=Gymnopus androsaceus JB14 TaxID=1447944 RepID=A0A6A4GB29_9AGAR|nr:hypothetical protein BT96DRAFT_1010205 [Gymnopus androsaceus JB14]